MNSSLLKIEAVLKRSADESTRVRDANAEFNLSPFLSGSFNLYRANVLDEDILFAESTAGSEADPRQLDTLAKAVHEPVAVFLPFASSSLKRTMMARRQGFVTEDGSMYLPQLALSLKAEITKKRVSTEAFTPSQQQAFLYCLLSEDPLTQEGLRDLTGMSAAGASRALSSLADARLVDYEIGGKTGRRRIYFVPDAAELYRRGRKLFGNPVKSIESLSYSSLAEPLDSGLTALARRSDLVAPRRRVVAVGPDIDISNETVKPGIEEKCRVQRLAYNPLPFSNNGMVDPFTMLMTIDDEDERISIALREALEGCTWYTD